MVKAGSRHYLCGWFCQDRGQWWSSELRHNLRKRGKEKKRAKLHAVPAPVLPVCALTCTALQEVCRGCRRRNLQGGAAAPGAALLPAWPWARPSSCPASTQSGGGTGVSARPLAGSTRLSARPAAKPQCCALLKPRGGSRAPSEPKVLVVNWRELQPGGRGGHTVEMQVVSQSPVEACSKWQQQRARRQAAAGSTPHACMQVVHACLAQAHPPHLEVCRYLARRKPAAMQRPLRVGGRRDGAKLLQARADQAVGDGHRQPEPAVGRMRTATAAGAQGPSRPLPQLARLHRNYGQHCTSLRNSGPSLICPRCHPPLPLTT